MAPATMSMIPEDSSRLEKRFMPWSSRYSSSASSGVIVRAWTVPGASGVRWSVAAVAEVGGPGRMEDLAGVAQRPACRRTRR